MKTETLIIAFLLALLIICSTIMRPFIPAGIFACVVFVLLIGLAYCLLRLFRSETQKLEEKILRLNQEVDSVNAELDKQANRIIEQLTAQSNAITEVSGRIIEDISRVQTALADSTGSILQSYREQSDRINGQLLSTIAGNDALKELVTSSVSELDGKLDGAKRQLDDVIQTMSTVRQQNSALQEAISANRALLAEETQSVIEITNQNKSELSDLIHQNGDRLTSSIRQTHDCILSASAMEIKAFNDAKEETNQVLQSIKDQYTSLQAGLTSLQVQIGNVERTIDGFAGGDSHRAVIDSIRSLMAELLHELQSDVSELRDEILENRNKQDLVTDQLRKLHVLLRSLDDSSGVEDSGQAQPEKEPSRASAREMADPNRTETIVDAQTGNIVLNRFENDSLVKSTMQTPDGCMIYELEYSNGQIVRSRNYDARGNLNIEQTFYDNGQVHLRSEITKEGRKTTEFDRNGNKK